MSSSAVPIPPTAGFQRKRSQLAGRLADLALAQGLGRFGLREIAAALGTSDRMLLYYFGSKSALVTAVLGEISQRLTAALAGSSLTGRLTPERFLTEAWAFLMDPELAPFMSVWAEVIARGARGEAPYDAAAGAGVAQWMQWVQDRLDLPDGPQKAGVAASILALLEGATLLEAARPGTTSGVQALMAEALAGLSR